MRTPNKLVFINCPFDSDYQPIFEAIVFAIQACEYTPKCALESIDSGYNRLSKILDLIDLCDFSLHDISRTESNLKGLPRFNMPFELGLALGCKYSKPRGPSRLLVLDRDPHRYLEFLSDLRGCDPLVHANDPHTAIARVRDWLASNQQERLLNGPRHLTHWFDQFQIDLPGICEECGLERSTLAFNDLVFLVRYWLEKNVPVA